MKHFLLVCFVPMTLAAQNMQQLTEKLGKTVLYGDLALSPDATHIAWVQSTAATTSRQTHIREISGDAPGKLVDIPITRDRTDFDPAWSPDSKTLAFFSSDGERGQRQLWTVKADGSDPKKLTSLNGYATRPRWSHNGKQIAFLYIEGAGGGGPLLDVRRMPGDAGRKARAGRPEPPTSSASRRASARSWRSGRRGASP